MKKVTILVGSARKKLSHHAAGLFAENLEKLGDVACETLQLSNHRLEICRGCKLCFEKGEELCPLKDDRDLLLEKLAASDGVVFVSPNYSFNVSGLMKVFLDRLGFVFHRPSYFGKTATAIVVQGIYGGGKIVKYFNFIINALGFNMVKGSCLTALEPMTGKDRVRIEHTLVNHSRRFHARLMKPQYPAPGIIGIIAFRMARSKIRKLLDEKSRDYTYFRDNGWFESGFYYPVKLNPFIILLGKSVDYFAK